MTYIVDELKKCVNESRKDRDSGIGPGIEKGQGKSRQDHISMSEIFGHSSKESDGQGQEDYHELCVYCRQWYDSAALQ